MYKLIIEIEEKRNAKLPSTEIMDVDIKIYEQGEGSKNEKFVANLLEKRMNANKKDEVIFCNKERVKSINDTYLNKFVEAFLKSSI